MFWLLIIKKFLERLIRDLTVNEVVLPYRLGEILLRSEDVVQKPGLSPTAEMLLKISQKEVPASVKAEDNAINRIHALFICQRGVLCRIQARRRYLRWRLPRLLGRA